MMTDLLAARSQMAMSLGFHIVFAALGIAMPVLMAAAELDHEISLTDAGNRARSLVATRAKDPDRFLN